MADGTLEPDPTRTDAESESVARRASRSRSPHRRFVITIVAICTVILITSAVFAWTKAQARDDAQAARDHALQVLTRQRNATATAQSELSTERHAVSTFEQQAQGPLTSAETGIDLLHQLLADVQAIQVAGTNLGTPEAEVAYNETRNRVRPLGDPLNTALNPLPGQIAGLRAATPN